MSQQYRVIIAALGKEGGNPTPVYEQVVENLDIKLVITAVNSSPREEIKPVERVIRRRSRRSDAGKPREHVTVTENA